MKHIPNILSFSRIPLSLLIFPMGLSGHWTAATLILLVGLATDVLDGAIASRYDLATKFGEDIAEPACDGILAAAAILTLAIANIWPWWSIPLVITIAGALQTISQLDLGAQRRSDYDQSLIKRLKRHQYYIHPYFFVVLIMATSVAFITQATTGYLYVVGFIVISAITIYLKRGRMLKLMAGPNL